MNRKLFIGIAVATGAMTSSAALADVPAVAGAGDSSYYFAFDEDGLREDLSRIRYFYFDQTVPAESDTADDDGEMVFVGGVNQGGFTGFWDPALPEPDGSGAAGGAWFDHVSVDWAWRPEVTGANDARESTRGMAIAGNERVGLRGDLTAMLNGGKRPVAGASVWRITGTLGATSASLAAPENKAVDGAGVGDLSWIVGVGWSTGAMSLSADYQGIHRRTDGLYSAPAILSLGADYAIVPGMSVFGEFNVIDDPALPDEDRLGTVIIVGTGLNF